jgi:uncharacterized protein YhaN
VRFEHVEAVSFGPLRDRAFDLDSDLVLVFGPNEAGKSSFRAALETLLYGFRPAERDEHPLALWDGGAGGNLHLEAQIRLDTDDLQSVERVLQATGKSRIGSGRAAFSGPRRGNACLPWVSWLSRDIFAALYSLELSQLAALDPSVREDVDALLLPTPSGLPLRAISSVRAELRRKQSELWRSDNRGKPRAKQLRGQLAAARAEAGSAQESERELRQARAEHAERETAVEALRARKRTLDAQHAESPLLGDLFELRKRQKELGAPLDLTALGDHSFVKPSSLAAQIADLEERMRAPSARLEQAEQQLLPQHEALLSAAAEIEHAVAARPIWQVNRQRFEEHREAARECRQRSLDEIAQALVVSPDEAVLQRIGDVPVAALKSIAAQWANERDAHAAETASLGRRVRGLVVVTGAAGFVAVLLGSLTALGFAAELPFPVDPRTGPGGALLLVASLIASLWTGPRTRGGDVEAPPELRESLHGLDVAEPLLDTPSGLQSLITCFESANRANAQARDAQRAAENCEQALHLQEQLWRSLAERLQLDARGPAEPLADNLRAELENARSRLARVTDDRNQRAEAQRGLERDAPLLARRREHAERLRSVLEQNDPGEPIELDGRYERVIERRKEDDFLRRREHELRAHPHFERAESDPRAHVDHDGDAPWLPEAVAAREREMAEIDDALAAEHHRLGELVKLLGSDPGSAFARASDRVREVERELAETERERDRLALLEAILTRADHEFRDTHQPDVLRRASAYLERVTLGRYPRIDLFDEHDGQLCVTPASSAEPVRVGEPLSQGTLDQIYLCLRLGLLDHLDEDRERLPLVLDDALLRMDDRRRLATYAVLGEIAPFRQILLLTCHEAVADEVEQALKVQRIDL